MYGQMGNKMKNSTLKNCNSQGPQGAMEELWAPQSNATPSLWFLEEILPFSKFDTEERWRETSGQLQRVALEVAVSLLLHLFEALREDWSEPRGNVTFR
mmetsp:Transcript_91908/g.173093  ORF Transcript_91908/g.173093 Transcript_91908/m.173093 type:complete len:99 (-) Transcript_91908:137-433(-)